MLNYLLKVTKICEQDSNPSHITLEASDLTSILPLLDEVFLDFYEEAMYKSGILNIFQQ